MKIFTNKKFIQKILIIFIIILLFQYAVPSNVANADWGGTLFRPIQELSLALGDVGTNALNLFVNGVATGSVLTLDKGSIIGLLFKIPVLGKINQMMYGGVYSIYNFLKVEFSEDDFVQQIELPISDITPDKIFSNKIALLDVNIINPHNTYEVHDENGKKVDIVPASKILQETIASWYIVLRNIVVVAFLSVLVYIGIRILMGTTSSDKAKYKQMLNDWIIGLCLVFLMHYIMSFAILMTEKITDLFSSQIAGIRIEANVNLSDFEQDADAKAIIDIYNEGGEVNGVQTLNWKTDLTGYVRFMAQPNINSLGVPTQFAYTMMYLVLVVYTFLFVFQYLKRLINIVFLTLVAPIVALAYPLDKISDGSPQAFNTWFKEYIFNLLLQPMHLILYTVLIGSASDLVTTHPIYALVVLGFLLQAEKLVRKMFGFEKASLTGAASTGAFAGAMVMQGLNAVVNGIKHKDGSKGQKGKSGGSSGDDSKVRMADQRATDNNSSDEDKFMRNTLGGGEQDSDETNDGGDSQNENPQNGDSSTEQENGGNSNRQINPPDLDDGTQDNTSESDTESVVQSGNYLHNSNPEEYDEYGNYRARDGKNFVKPDPEKERKNNEKQKNREKRRLKRIDRMQNTKAAVRYFAPKVGKAIAKGSAMAVGAGTLGMVGMAAGLASDDFKNVGSYTAAAIGGGALVGNIAANKVMKAPANISNKVEEARNAIAKERYKDDPNAYKQYLNDRADKAFLRDKEIEAEYATAFGETKAHEMMEYAIEYRRHGITDNKLIINTMKEKSGDIGKTDFADNRRIAAAKLASGVQNSKDIENMTKRLKNQGFNDKVINQNEEFIRSVKKLKFN